MGAGGRQWLDLIPLFRFLYRADLPNRASLLAWLVDLEFFLVQRGSSVV